MVFIHEGVTPLSSKQPNFPGERIGSAEYSRVLKLSSISIIA